MDQEELDRQYSPSKWSKRPLPSEKLVDLHIQHFTEATARAQKELKCELGVCYDSGSGQVVDIYFPPTTTQPDSNDPPAVLIYIHGGYWAALGVEHSGYLALPLAARGIATVAVGYDLAPQVSMTTIVQQCRKACAFAAKRFSGSKLFVCGASAGGHLSACMLYTDWSQYGLKTQPFSGAILFSGIYDLDPIQRSFVNKPLQLTEAEVREFSPQKNLKLIEQQLPSQFPCMLAVGGEESDEFQRQGEEFHQGLLSVGMASMKLTLPGKDHFNLVESLNDAHNILAEILETCLLKLCQAAPPTRCTAHAQIELGKMAVDGVMEQRELNRQYTPSLWSKRLPPERIVDNHCQHFAEATARARKELKCELGVCYDSESGQVVDIYFHSTAKKDSNDDPPAVLIYIHGGYWSALGVEHSGYLALPLAARGIATVAVGYDLAPKVSMTTIVQQCRKACAFVAERFSKSKLFVCGHSAGGHLSACMLYTDWSQYGLKTQPFSGAILFSGIYDLDPIQKSHVNRPLQLTETKVREFSPQKNLKLIEQQLPRQFPCMLAVGGEESDEFQRQGEEFHQGLLSVGVASINSALPGKDHFNLVEDLTDAENQLSQTLLTFITAHT